MQQEKIKQVQKAKILICVDENPKYQSLKV